MNIINTENQCNIILENIKRIDRNQKKAVIADNNTCISCDATLLSTINNTIPISLTTCCGNRITGIINLDGTTTYFFRVEAIRCNRYLTVRMLEEIEVEGVATLVETPYTMVVDLECVGTMQCFTPISITLCTQSLAMSDDN